MIITREEFMDYRRVQKSDKMNMFGYWNAKKIIPNFNALLKHFEVENHLEDFEVPK